MADKTTTLTTQTGDSIYPNVLDENVPDTIARVSDVNKLKTDVETAYLTKSNAEATYQTQTGRADYVSKTYGDGTYATITQLGGKQDKLTAGSNITIEGTTIAAVRPENRALYGDLAATDEEFTGGTGGGDNLLKKPSGLTKTVLVGVGTNGQENIEIGDNLTLANGKLSATGGSSGGEKTLTISITDILTDNNKILELFSKITSTTEQSALIWFDKQISYDTYKDYDTIKLDLSPLSSMGVSGYYILRNQSYVNGYSPVYNLTTVGFSTINNNLDKLVIKHLIIAGDDIVNSPLNKFLLKIL